MTENILSLPQELIVSYFDFREKYLLKLTCHTWNKRIQLEMWLEIRYSCDTQISIRKSPSIWRKEQCKDCNSRIIYRLLDLNSSAKQLNNLEEFVKAHKSVISSMLIYDVLLLRIDRFFSFLDKLKFLMVVGLQLRPLRLYRDFLGDHHMFIYSRFNRYLSRIPYFYQECPLEMYASTYYCTSVPTLLPLCNLQRSYMCVECYAGVTPKIEHPNLQKLDLELVAKGAPYSIVHTEDIHVKLLCDSLIEL
jgi:DNA-directed RNA polymerase subunit RPC12/RpoP